MRNRMKTHLVRDFVPATGPGPNPADLPVGSLQSRAAARAMVANFVEEERRQEEAELANLTSFERAVVEAVIEDVDRPLVRIIMIQLFRAAQERARVYEQDLHLPTPEEIRHQRAVAKEIHRMTGGTGSTLQTSNPEEWYRLKAIAEERLAAVPRSRSR
jgi:hypothetical protein